MHSRMKVFKIVMHTAIESIPNKSSTILGYMWLFFSSPLTADSFHLRELPLCCVHSIHCFTRIFLFHSNLLFEHYVPGPVLGTRNKTRKKSLSSRNLCCSEKKSS